MRRKILTRSWLAIALLTIVYLVGLGGSGLAFFATRVVSPATARNEGRNQKEHLAHRARTRAPSAQPMRATAPPTIVTVMMAEDDYTDVYAPQFILLDVNAAVMNKTAATMQSGATKYPTRRKTNMPTHPYSRAPTFASEREEEEESDGKPRARKHLLPIAFEPFAEHSAAWEIHQDKREDFPPYHISPLVANAPPARVRRNSGIHVITTFFRGTYTAARVREVLAALVSNLENPYITAVHCLWEEHDPRGYLPPTALLHLTHKLVLKPVRRQPTYRQLFQYANTQLERGAIAIISNGDIYFDQSVGCLQTRAGKDDGDDLLREPRRALALSRRRSPLCGSKPEHDNAWVTLYDLCLEYTEAHDAFVFAPPVPQTLVNRVAHTQNAAYGAENVVIFELRRANFSVFNYCHTIHAMHNHCGNDRHSSPHLSVSKIPGRNRHGIKHPSGEKKDCGEIWVY